MKKGLGLDALATGASSMLGVGASVVLDAIVVACFGLGSKTDSYFIALTVPMVLITMLQLQASKVVQPLFINLRENAGEKEGWRFLDLAITMSIGAVAFLVVAGIVLSPALIHVQAPGFTGEARNVATNLSRWFFLVLLLYCPIAVMRVALNVLGDFALPASMKAVQSLFNIFFVVTLAQSLGVSALALGMFAGAVFQIVMYYLALRRKGYRFRLHFSFDHPELLKGIRMMAFPLAGHFTGMGVEVLNNYLGSLLGPGSVSALRFATRIIESVSGTFVYCIITAVAPAITTCLSSRDYSGAKEKMREGVRLLLLVTIPLSAWLFLMREPVIALIYQRMSFSAADTLLVANVLTLTIPYIFFSPLLGLAELVFFGDCDTRTPFLGSVSVSFSYVILAVAMFSRLGIYALPVARSLSYLGGSILMLYLAHRRIGGMRLRMLSRSFGRILLACVAMIVPIILLRTVVNSMGFDGVLLRILSIGPPSMLGGGAFVVVLYWVGLLDVPTLRALPMVGKWLVGNRLR